MGLGMLVPAFAESSSCPGRETLLMNFGWKFHKGALQVNDWYNGTKSGRYGIEPLDKSAQSQGIGMTYDDSSWRTLDLPHDFTVEAFASEKGNMGHGYFPAEVGWYRRHFTIPASDKGRRISVEFEGAFQTTTVYCNNFIVGVNRSGYGPFQFDITDFIQYGGENVLSVCVDGTMPEGWWYEGGGIYRDVHLVKTAPVHIPWGGVQVQSWFKTDPDDGSSFLADAPEGPAKLRVRTAVTNKGSVRREVLVRVKVLDPAGNQVAEGRQPIRVGPWGEVPAVIETQIAQPCLWSLETPQLYTAKVELETDGAVVDCLNESFGVRTVRFDPQQGFFLNGKSVKIKGAANHQDHAGIGIALPDAVVEYRLKRLKEFGFNAYRTAHHPGGPVTRVADRVGMLVLAENRKFSTGEQGLKDLRSLVLSCRNSPSVVAWNIGNEELAFQGTALGGQVAGSIRDCIRSMDATRPVTMGQNEDHEKPGSAATALDVVGFNYTCNYEPSLLKKVFELYKNKPLLETEMANTYTSRGVYENQELQGRLLSYEKPNFNVGTFTMTEVKRLLERPFMCGGFIWTGFDYRGEPAPFYPDRWAYHKKPGKVPWLVSCHFGVFDLCGFPKDAAYYYQSAYAAEPMVHLFPHWNWKGKEGQPIEVWVYSNCEELDLIVNGKSQGRKPMPKLGYLSWTVPFEPGAIEALGYKNGSLLARDKQETTGEPVAVVLTPDRPTLKADHEDVGLVTMQVVDAQGRPVPTASNTIRFRLEGPARLLGSGNGDAATREPDKVPVRSLWVGLAQVLVQTLDHPGTATLIAESDGLRPAKLDLTISASPRRAYLPSPVEADRAMWSDIQGSDKSAETSKPAVSGAVQQDDYSFYESNAVTNSKKKK